MCCWIRLLPLALVFIQVRSGDWGAQGPEELFRPTITALQGDSPSQSLQVSWLLQQPERPASSLLEGRPIYEVQVGRTRNLTVVHTTNVSVYDVDGAGVVKWTWISSLPLECADHSVRIRQYDPNLTPTPASTPSSWSIWMTSNGVQPDKENGTTQVFPPEGVLRERSSPLICCIPPRGAFITSMEFNRTYYTPVELDDGGRAIQVNPLTVTAPLGVYFSYQDSLMERSSYHSYFVSFPPPRPENLTCGTTDRRTVTCTWESGRKTNLPNRNELKSSLIVQGSGRSPVSCSQAGSCEFTALEGVEEYHVTVVAENLLGVERQSYGFNISKRVFPIPEQVFVWPGVRDANVSWRLEGNMSDLGLLCQVMLPDTSDIRVNCGSLGEHCGVTLENLEPNTLYPSRLRCSVRGGLWGPWTEVPFTTLPLVSLDTWGWVRKHSASHWILTLLWTRIESGSASTGGVQGYRVEWRQGEHSASVLIDKEETQTELSIGPEQCDVTAEAVLQRGSSIPSHLSLPRAESRECPSQHQRVSGNGTTGFQLSWVEKKAVTCGYTVEWCTMGGVVPCKVTWRKVPVGHASLYLPADKFNVGRRYTFNIYGCTEDGERCLESQTGYLQELKPTLVPTLITPVHFASSSVTLEWRYNDDDPAHPGFIIGYQVTVITAGIQSTAAMKILDRSRKSVTIPELQEHQEYTFRVCALTKEGPGPETSFTGTTSRNYPVLLAKILTPTLLLLACAALLWPQRNMLRSGFVEVFGFSADLNIQDLQLDRHLSEASERLGSLKEEECRCCNIEIVNIRPTVTDGAILLPPQPSSSTPLCSSQLLGDYCPQPNIKVWDRQVCQGETSLTNHTYLPTVGVEQSTATQPIRLKDVNVACGDPDWSDLDD
ncbi:leukemia inhibitory factor receptor [Osmerus eperlanus]|uniref:leukemia inhibitory factor receptor n=1 Tax=Osmerus eperlanus TaxID=29151 RepID=UPI002E153055